MASPARWAALVSYLVVQCVGFLVAYLLLRVPRAPLPHDEVAALAAEVGADGVGLPWPRARIRVHTSPGAFRDRDEEALFVQLLARAASGGAEDDAEEAPEVSLERGEELPGAVAHLRGCLGEAASHEAAQACASHLEDAAADESAGPAGLDRLFHVLVVPSTGCSALVLDAGTGAVLAWHRGAAPLAGVPELAAAAGAHLRAAWLRRARLRNEAALFEVAPAYVFSFFLVGDCSRRIAWDFLSVVLAPFLGRFLERLRLLIDFEVDSQVVQCGSLGGSGSVISAAALREDFLRRAGEWPGDTVTRGAPWLPPLVRFVAFKPSSPVRVVDPQQRPQRSFAVQGWGAVVVVGPTDVGEAMCEDACAGAVGSDARVADVVTRCEARQAASAWVSSLRSWLTLPPDSPLASAGARDADDEVDGRRSCGADGLAVYAARPSLDGIALWELLVVSRAVQHLFLVRSVETLENLIALVDSLPDVVVRAEIAEMIYEAAAQARLSASAARSGDLRAALLASRRALAYALTASHDDTVVAQMYFSWEFKYAVYLPIGLPIAVPIFVALIRHLRRERALRQAKHRELGRVLGLDQADVS